MIKAYHMVGSDEWTPEERAEALDEILSVGKILPAIDRLDRGEMKIECFTGENRGATVEQQFDNVTPKVVAALKEIAQEKIDRLPESGFTHSLFNCLDLIAGDLELVFLRPGDWYSQDNGFVFNAEELLKKGARFRPTDLLGDFSAGIEVVGEHSYRTVKQARKEIEAMITLIKGDREFEGDYGIEALRECLQEKWECAGDNTKMEIVWPGPLPVSLAIEMWSDGKNVTKRLKRV